MSGSHSHAHEHDHPHPHQPDLEDGPFTHHMALTEAVIQLLRDKGVVSSDDLRRAVEIEEARNPANGARLIARAWVDEAFRARLLDDVNAAALSEGIDPGAIPIRAVADTPELKNVIVCTLCSCYPVGLLGASPAWYKSRAYRSRVVREPRAILAEFGLEMPDGVRIEVHDSTAELRYIVVPQRPTGTEGWDAERLAAIVTRDVMIGTALPKP